MNKERLSRLITQYQKNLEFYRNAREFNEQDCRDEFISPLLESFGWDVHNEKGTSPQYKEVVVEKFSNSGDRPDYTLTLNGVYDEIICLLLLEEQQDIVLYQNCLIQNMIYDIYKHG